MAGRLHAQAGANPAVFRARVSLAAALFLGIVSSAAPASAQERMLFPAIHDAEAAIVQKINAEQVRVDVAVWYLQDSLIANALVNKFRAGVPVRVLGDRVSLFEIDPITRQYFELLASNGIPIRVRYHPTWFPEIMHWKAGIFVGQNTVEFGSANWTPFELAPWSPTNFKDETVMFTDDPAIVRGFLTQFDRMWADTTSFLDWPEAYRLDMGTNWPTPMSISRARLEPDYPSPPGMIWSQGAELNNAMAAEIDREQTGIDFIIYRLSDPVITDALVRRLQAGVPVRVFIEPHQYRAPEWPEYWLTGAHVDRLWLAGAQIKQRTHEGLTHMKSLITSHVALNGSSNFTRNWQRDHNYFIPAQGKPALYFAMKDRFNAMWNDGANYTHFSPQRPEHPVLVGPASGGTGVSATPTLEWRRARWATAFDVYLGTTPGGIVFQGRVNAQLDENPPQTYSWTPSQPLQANTTYYWRIVSRTFATDRDPAIVAPSEIGAFSTGPTGTGPTPSPTPEPAPSPGPQPAPVSNPHMWLDTPADGASVGGVVSVAGWAVDLGAPSGSGVSTVHVWAFPTTGGGPIFLGVPTLGVSRPDVGGVFGARFTPSGFGMSAQLAPGSYYIAVYALSAVTGTFNNSRIALVTVVSPATIPRMAVDLPTVNQTVAQHFAVAGWALDLGAASGAGVEAIHVWAYPLAGGDPVFVGATTPGVWRPDVAAAFGDSRFGAAGYSMEGHLPPGEYNLVVFAFSAVARNFNNAIVIRIRVN